MKKKLIKRIIFPDNEFFSKAKQFEACHLKNILYFFHHNKGEITVQTFNTHAQTFHSEHRVFVIEDKYVEIDSCATNNDSILMLAKSQRTSDIYAIDVSQWECHLLHTGLTAWSKIIFLENAFDLPTTVKKK